MPSDHGDLRELWTTGARRASDAQLAACVAASIVVALAFTVFALVNVRRALQWWPLVLPPLLAGTFGIWGIADREIEDPRCRQGLPRVSRRALVAIKWFSALAAGLVGLLAAIGILRVTIGTWIS